MMNLSVSVTCAIFVVDPKKERICIKEAQALGITLIGLGCEARINTPSTLGGNWIWRSDEDSFTDNLAAKIKKITQLCARSLQQKGE